MGFLDSIKKDQLGNKAYRQHVTALQLRKQGKIEEAQKRLDEAFKLYGEAYAQGFRKPSAMLAYGILTMQRGDFPRARELMLECSKDKTMSKEDRATLRINYAVLQWRMGNVDKAIETIRTASGNTASGTIYTTLGMFLVDKARATGDFEEAKAYLQEAMEYDDEDAATLDNMGMLSLAMAEKAQSDGDAELAAENRTKAYEYFKKAHDEKADQITSAYYLAMLELEKGNKEAARDVLDDVIHLPMTALCPVSREDIEALSKKIG